MSVTVVETETVFQGRLLEMRLEKLRLADGTLATREMVVHGGAAAIAPIDDRGRVLLVSQYRHGARQELWELPAGVVDGDESPAAAAARELREETGLSAVELRPLLEFFVSPGYCTELLHVFAATGLSQGTAEPEADEDLDQRWFELAEAVAMCLDGRIRDAKTICGLLALSAAGGKAGPGGPNARSPR